MLTQDALAQALRQPSDSTDERGDDRPLRPIQHYRTLWISDLHLGTPGCQAQALLD